MRWTLAILTLISLTSAKAIDKRWSEFETKHAWAEVPQGWVLHSAAPADHKLKMRIGLRQNKFDELVKNLYEVSDPAHPRYGAHLSKEEVEALVAPHPDAVQSVEDWLKDHDVDTSKITRSPAGDWLSLSVSVEQAERMLNAKYNTYYHPDTLSYVVRTEGYSLPRALLSHVDVVTPTTYFGNTKALKRTSFRSKLPPISDEDVKKQLLDLRTGATPSSCSSSVTPACLRALYNTTVYATKSTGNVLGVVGYLDEYANRADLQTFFKKFRPDATSPSYSTVLVNGGDDDQSNPGTEANLDIQYTSVISYPTPNIYYSVGGSPPFVPDSFTPSNTNEPYLDFLNFISTQSTIPQTFTTSYGDDEQTVPQDYATSVCNMFAQLGARGSSFMFSSGDEGVGGGSCRNNDGTNTVRFQPAFPASCPFVTAVGGTNKFSPEVAVSFSGGGFSNYFARPSYQNSQVTSFFSAIGTTNAGKFNTTGRAYPDVAAQGVSFQVVIGGRTAGVSGTSASSPAFAGVVSLLNDHRLANGKPALGFLNPLLYSSAAASAFNDITSGSNPGCGTNGFSARAGWDPVTGLGTPDFGKLQPVVMAA